MNIEDIARLSELENREAEPEQKATSIVSNFHPLILSKLQPGDVGLDKGAG